MKKETDPDVDRKKSIVGKFYEKASHRTLGGKLTRNEDGDLCLWDIDTTVEVKGSSYQSSQGFRLDREQIEGYEQLSLFPFSRALYLFWAYQNPSRATGQERRRSTALSAHKTPEAINEYLARNTLWCLVYDLRIVSRWRETLPISTKSNRGHQVDTVDLKCHAVHDLANGGFSEGLAKLDLNPDDFAVLTSSIKIGFTLDGARYRVACPLTAVLEKEKLPILEEWLAGRGLVTARRTD